MDKVFSRIISAFARKIAKQFNPQKIILFGSYAYGKPTEDSDVDILVVMSFSGRNPEKATEIWMASKPKFPVDIMVRKPDELKKRLAMGDFFLRDVVNKGRALYEAAHA
ncbi:MAG: nucleotidyltransferase domain-containing protein [Chloroflexota bacterium]